MKNIPLSHFFPWGKISDDFVVNTLCEFADNGAQSVVLTDTWGKRLVYEPGFYTTLLSWLRESSMKIFECHGLWSTAYDLNITDRPRRRAMIDSDAGPMSCTSAHTTAITRTPHLRRCASSPSIPLKS